MEKVVRNILDALREKDSLDAAELDAVIRRRSAEAHDGRRVFAKKRILPFYLAARAESGELWRSWSVDDELDRRFVKALQMKPRRSASGVATITVITKPWPCANSCVYCPNDPTMPKSYLADEPACQRAALNEFDPFRQVTNRLRTLEQMGHATDKVELIVLGGTWLDYPADYRTWFVSELFRALNSETTPRDLPSLHAANEHAAHRCVGLVFETRPDTVTPETLTEMRALGCTKIQLGVQSVNDDILRANGRHETVETIREAFALCRLFGFKVHAHFMVNLLGATPESDIADYRTFANGAPFQPDEVKLYPCALVASAPLVKHYEDGTWRPYSENELVSVLQANLRDTPAFTRVSRMIRDISSDDILVGNKKTNLRQLVEAGLGDAERADIQEIRFREIGTEDVDLDALRLDEIEYDTGATTEHFLQWVTPDNRIAGFLRLSLPRPEAIASRQGLPVAPDEAMIREVHVYGFATRISADGASAQHHGLGRSLVERACEIARDAGRERINVISAIGTRDYYRRLGFQDSGLYQVRCL